MRSARHTRTASRNPTERTRLLIASPLCERASASQPIPTANPHISTRPACPPILRRVFSGGRLSPKVAVARRATIDLWHGPFLAKRTATFGESRPPEEPPTFGESRLCRRPPRPLGEMCHSHRAHVSGRHLDQRASHAAAFQIRERLIHAFEGVVTRNEVRERQFAFLKQAGVAWDIAVRHRIATPTPNDSLAANEIERVEGDLLALWEIARQNAQPAAVANTPESGFHRLPPTRRFHGVIGAAPGRELQDGGDRIAVTRVDGVCGPESSRAFQLLLHHIDDDERRRFQQVGGQDSAEPNSTGSEHHEAVPGLRSSGVHNNTRSRGERTTEQRCFAEWHF